MSYSQHHDTTIFSVPIRWAIRVLAWLAFFIASYLVWHAAMDEAVAGCTAGSGAGCDMVLSSSWSKWLSVPVSIAGLACYATLAGFSVLIGLTGPRENRWIDTLVVMLSILAAGASIWFLGLQVFAIGYYCPYCIVVDSIGIVLGALALWSALRTPSASSITHKSGANVAALKAAFPGAGRVAPLHMPQATTRPSLAIALGGAGALLAVLIGGQILWPHPTHQTGTVALDQPITMTGATPDDAQTSSDVTPKAQTHVAMRVSAEEDSGADSDADAAGNDHDSAKENTDAAPTDGNSETADESANGSTNGSTNGPPAGTSPKKKRLVKFLGGKLTLDIYQHPILGNPEAPHVIVELVSYDCSHCRKMHPIVQRAMRRYGSQIAVLIVPVPMEMKCNRLIKDPKASHMGACTTARMALAVARLKPAAFRGFHDWMMEDEKKPPTQAQSVAKAYSMVDSSKLPALTRGEELNKQIQQYVDLFGTLQQQNAGNKNFGLPIQILGDEVMAGSVEKADDVFKAWEKNLGIKPQ